MVFDRTILRMLVLWWGHMSGCAQVADARQRRRMRKERAARYAFADPEMLERLLADDALLHSRAAPALPPWADQLP